MFLISILVAGSFTLAGCGSRLSGTYLPSGKPPSVIGFVYEKFEFGSGETVDIVIMDVTRRGTYKIDGKKVAMTLNGESLVMVMDDKGCLDGGELIGKYCKK
jgi:hypothetical protein